MNSYIQQARDSCQIYDVLARYNLRPDRAGFIRCPFHIGDHTASLKVYPENNSWYCFGCNRGGDVIDFVKEMEHCTVQEALKLLNDWFALGFGGAKISLRQKRQAEQERADKARSKQEERRQLLELIAKRRAKWREQLFIEPAPGDHEAAQRKALLLAEIEQMDYVIESRWEKCH